MSYRGRRISVMKDYPIIKPLGFKLTKLDESRLILAAALAGITKSELAREGVKTIVEATLRRVAGELVASPDGASLVSASDKETLT